MTQTSLAYSRVTELGPGRRFSLTLVSDCDQRRKQFAAGFEVGEVEIRHSIPFAHVLSCDAMPLGDLVIVDCPEVRGDTLTALLLLDERAATVDCQLIVMTSLEALDDVYACIGHPEAQILVSPTQGERVLALGRALSRNRTMRVRELSQDDRVTLLRLTEQVEDIARRLEEFPQRGPGGVFYLESSRRGYRGEKDGRDRPLRASKPPLPDPRLVREIINRRQKRREYFDGGLFADPAWDMLLDLTAARVEHRRVSVTSLCIASGVPATTALRWISQMVESGLFERVEDEADRRRAFIALTDTAADAMARYFAEIGGDLV